MSRLHPLRVMKSAAASWFARLSHFLIRRLLPFLLLLSVSSLSRGATLPWSPLAGKKPEPQQQSQGVTALTDNSIDETRKKLESRLAELRLQSGPEAVAAQQRSYPEATSQELNDWERQTGKLAGILEAHDNTLLRLKDLRKANHERSMEIKSWQGFAEKPPFNITFLDNLRDAIVANQITLQSLELARSTAEGEFEDFSDNLKKSRKQVRLAEENAELGKGKPGEARQGWLLVLARLHDEVNQAGAVYAETRRVQLQEAVAGIQAEIRFLEQKLAVAKGMYRFTQEELKQKLQAIESRSKELDGELDQAERLEETARVALDAAETKLRAAQKDFSRGGASKEKHDAALKSYGVRQIIFEAADTRVQILKAVLLLLRNETRIWNERYLLAATDGKQAYRPNLEEYRKDQELIENWKRYAVSRIVSLQLLIGSEQEKLSHAALPGSDRETERSVLAAYQEQASLLRRGNEILIEYERLVQRRNDEAKLSTAPASLKGRAQGGLDTVSSWALAAWDSVLYVAEETTIVEGNKIVRPRSVTVGKLIEAFLILLVGSWVIRRLKRLFLWIAANRLKLKANDAQLYSRLFSYLMFVCLLLSALFFVNIPLAVFAFLGGALAIGIGFGAQTLINNFISGIILMFDRTIRVGDVVEVDTHRGSVASIGMRSSSIRRFDGVEMLVPNSLFLQQNVINWTSSDRRVRYSIAVGVAYGSPTQETARVILQAVEEQPEVLADPLPYVVFENFAESSLNFVAYLWLELNPAVNSLVVLSDIRHRLGERLAEAGIVIPFPQRDLRLNAGQPIEVKVISSG